MNKKDLPNWDDAPEWADRLMKYKDFKYWCNVSHYSEVGFNKTSSASVKFSLDGALTIGHFELLEIRPIAIEDKEWLPMTLPSIGTECEMVASAYNDNEVPEYGSDGLPIEIVAYKGNMAVFVYEHDGEWYASMSDNWKHFRPLKTADELEREAFIDAAMIRMPKWNDDSFQEVTTQVLDILARAGFTAPKGEG